MNKSYSKKRHIQEANQRLEQRLLSEQSGAMWLGANNMDKVARAMNDYYKENPHLVNQVAQIAALIIPVVGPFISAGIGLADAATYAKEVIQIVNSRRVEGEWAAGEEGGALGGLAPTVVWGSDHVAIDGCRIPEHQRQHAPLLARHRLRRGI